MTKRKYHKNAPRMEDPDFSIIRHENRGKAIDVAFWLDGNFDVEAEVAKLRKPRK